MITKIELTNFKSHAHTVIEPGRVTALVGPNGCGKTGVLQALNCFINSLTKPPSQVFTEEMLPDFLVTGQGKEFSINVVRDFGKTPFKINIKLDTVDQFVGHPRYWYITVEPVAYPPVGRVPLLESNDIGRLPESSDLRFEDVLQQSTVEYFKASPKNLSQPSSVDEYPPKLNSNGTGLSSVIANIILSEPDRLEAIEKALCEIVPSIKKIKARHVSLNEVEKSFYLDKGILRKASYPINKPGYEIVFDTSSTDAVPAHSMSEGTLLLLGMLTLLYSPHPPGIFLLEDIEQGLHPLAQRQMISVLKNFAEKHERQIVLTSHSPYIIDELKPEDVWVMNMDKEGVSHTKRLSEHPDAGRALGVLTTGELWDAEGENWVIENSAEPVNA